MIKCFFLIIALASIPILIKAVSSINRMSHKTCDIIRWAYISIAIGSGAEIMAFLSVMSINYGTWDGVKTMLFGALCINIGYSILHMYKSPGRLEDRRLMRMSKEL